LVNDEFELEYQPRIDLRSTQVVAMEALIRWNHPQLGRIPPLDFIPIAEEIGLIGDLGRWALEKACVFASDLALSEYPVRVSVNVSAQQLTDIRIAEDIESALANARLKPELLELELTESLLIEDRQRCAELLRRLRAMGVSLSVDDFGTGYSSLAYLQLFPVNAIKLDKTFVNGGEGGTNNLRLVKALIDLAHALDLEVVAEGVESVDVLRFLHASGCDEIQGYLVARPLKPAEFRHFLRGYVPSFDHVACDQPAPQASPLAAAA
jgi:EAL domain-containing protein (putative c-di-GMP-specific phosphodiesterase class I)